MVFLKSWDVEILLIIFGIDFAPIEWPLQPLTEKVRNSQCSFIILLTFWFLSKHEYKLLFIIKVLYWSVTTNFEAPNDQISLKSHGDLTSLIDKNCLFDLKKFKMYLVWMIIMKKKIIFSTRLTSMTSVASATSMASVASNS